MSLESLRQLRRSGEKPDAIVKVIVGRRHLVLDGAPDVIAIADGEQPQHMDWRAVIDLPVVLFVCDGAKLGERVYDCILSAGAKVMGAVWSDVTLAPDETKPVLRRMWEALCTS